MPQLMPLLWVNSIFMVLMLIIVLYVLYHYMELFLFLKTKSVLLNESYMFKW